MIKKITFEIKTLPVKFLNKSESEIAEIENIKIKEWEERIIL